MHVRNLLLVGSQIINTIVTVALLVAGLGIVGLAIANLASAVFLTLSLSVAMIVLFPAARFRRDAASRHDLLSIGKSSVATFIVRIATTLAYQTDNIVIGAVLGAAAVAPYAVASRAISYWVATVWRMTDILLPSYSRQWESGGSEAASRLFLTNCKYALALGLAGAVVLFAFADKIAILWLGTQYAIVGPILRLLVVAWSLDFMGHVASILLFGLQRQKALAFGAGIFAVLNVVLGVLLVHVIGVYGPAVGTLVMTFGYGLFTYFYAARSVDLSSKRFVTQVLFPVALPMGVECLAAVGMLLLMPPRNLLVVVLECIVCLATFAVCYML